MTNDKPPSKEMCLRMAELLFDGPFKRSTHLGWQYLVIWAMYDHGIENYWSKA